MNNDDINVDYNDAIEILTKIYGYDENLIDIDVKIKNNKIIDVVGYTSRDKKKIQFFIEYKNYIGDCINDHTKKIALETNPDFFIVWKNYEINKTYKLIHNEIIEIGHIPKLYENISKNIKIDDPVMKFQRIIKHFKIFGSMESDYIIDLAKIIVCKIYDEEKKTDIFSNFTIDHKNNLEQLEIIWKKISTQHPEFNSYKTFSCHSEIITRVCNEIKNFSFSSTTKYDLFSGYVKAIDSNYNITSSSIIKTISILLQMQNNKKIMLPFCYYGNIFFTINQLLNTNTTKNNKNMTYYGIVEQKIQKIIIEFVLKYCNMKNTIYYKSPSSNSHIEIKNYDYAIIPLLLNIKSRRSFNDIGYDKDLQSNLIHGIIQNLNYGGKIGVLTSHNFLSDHKYENIRKWLIKNCNIRAIISIPNHNAKLSIFSLCMIIIEKNKNLSDDKIFVSYNQDRYNDDSIIEISKLEKIFKNLILQFGLFQHIKKIQYESDEAFLINKSELKNNWNVKYLLPTYKNMMNKLSNKKQLCEISEIISGKSISSIHRFENGIPYIRISDIQNNILNIENCVKINDKNIKTSVTKIHAGDILISIRGTIGKISIVPAHLSGCYLSSQLAIIRIKNNNIDSKFIKYQLQYSKLIKQQLLYYQKGSFIQNISINDVKKLHVAILSIDQQKQYLKKIDKLLHNELILKENLKKMRSELDELL